MGGLLERDAFLSSLASYAADVVAGHGRLVLVAGEPGVGKTELLERFASATPGLRWLWGACDGLSTPRPLSPLHDVALQVGGPLLEGTRRGAPRDSLFDALREDLAGRDGCTALVVEDAHWADEATLDLLRFLTRRLGDLRTLLLVTYRDEALGVDHPLQRALGDLAGYRGTRRIHLPCLTTAAVARLAEGTPFAPEDLHDLTGGNPFFVTEVLAGDGSALPPSARDAVLARAGRLDPPARAALEAAAVLGRPDCALLLELPGVTTAGIDGCCAAGLLEQEGGRVAFRHELARLAVADATAPQRRTALHAAALAALTARGADAAALSHHAAGAADTEAVLRHAPVAAEEAARVASHRAALAQYELALRFADGTAPAARAALLDRLADEAALVDRWEDSARARFQALALWRQLGDGLRAGDALRRLAGPMYRLARGAEGLRLAREALALVEPHPPGPELAWALANLANELKDRGALDDARALSQRAQALARELDLPDVLSDALNSEGCAVFLQGGDGAPLLREALAVAQAAQVEGGAGRAYANLHWHFTNERRFAEQESVFVAGTAYCDAHEITTYGTCIRGDRGCSLLLQGRPLAARDHAAGLLRRYVPSPANRLPVTVALGWSLACLGEGDPDTWLDEALELARGIQEESWLARVHLARAETRWLAGDLAAAREEALASHEHAQSCGAWQRGQALLWLHRLGEPQQAAGVPEPFAAELAGEHAVAAALLDRRAARHDAVLALLHAADTDLVRAGLERAVDAGAQALAARGRQRLRELGATAVPAGPRPATRAHPCGLTPREQEVLDLLAEELSNAAIASRLVLSERTVDHHVAAVLRKLEASSRGAATARARELGLVGART